MMSYNTKFGMILGAGLMAVVLVVLFMLMWLFDCPLSLYWIYMIILADLVIFVLFIRLSQ